MDPVAVYRLSLLTKASVLTFAKAGDIYFVVRGLWTLDYSCDIDCARSAFRFHHIYLVLAGICVTTVLSAVSLWNGNALQAKNSRQFSAVVLAFLQIGHLWEVADLWNLLCMDIHSKALANLSPIDDLRSSLFYRQDSASQQSGDGLIRDSDVVPVCTLPHRLQCGEEGMHALRRLMIAHLPEAIASLFFHFIAASICVVDPMSADHRSGIFRANPLDLVVFFGNWVFSFVALASGVADIVVCVWSQTDFVRRMKKFVFVYYVVEILCRVPPVMCIICLFSEQRHSAAVAASVTTFSFLAPSIFIFFGFSRRNWFRKGARRRCDLFIQGPLVAIAQSFLGVCLAIPLFMCNLFYFDESHLFWYLNRCLQWVRFFEGLGLIALHFRPGFVGSKDVHTWNGFGQLYFFVVFTVLHFVLTLGVVPRKKAALINKMRETKEVVDVVVDDCVLDVEGATVISLSPVRCRSSVHSIGSVCCEEMEEYVVLDQEKIPVRRGPVSRANGPHSPSFSMVDCSPLHRLSDTFEYLLLASKSDSPRVRTVLLQSSIDSLEACCVRRTAHNNSALAAFLPSALTQLLLALRWQCEWDEDCCSFTDGPVTRFIFRHAKELRDYRLVSLCYWRLLALSMDNSDKFHAWYRLVRQNFVRELGNGDEWTKWAVGEVLRERNVFNQMRNAALVAHEGRGHQQRNSRLHFILSNQRKWKKYFESRPQCGNVESSDRSDSGQTLINGFSTSSMRKGQMVDAPIKILPSRIAVLHAEKKPTRCWLNPLSYVYGRRQKPLQDPFAEEWGHDTFNVDAKVAKSALAPVVLACNVEEYESAPGVAKGEPRAIHVALKFGDDMRQDELVLQLFALMDNVWKESGVKISLNPYSVLALSPKEGMVEYVRDSVTLSKAMAHPGGLYGLLERYSENLDDALMTLCSSAAGYCVATYLLAIGDRHLDNIMIQQSTGHFFHIDFGFILGFDPKPVAPLVRMPGEVIAVLQRANLYTHFQRMLADAFVVLRRNHRLWISLLGITASAGGSKVNLSNKPNAEARLVQMRKRMLLDVDEERARDYIVDLVDRSAKGILPIVWDKIHDLGLFWN
eukprot:GEMP01007706.1.p1 GENE.GEMP01007706.1~~GEMP01007706.1.p1  ORF type:complete len:1081 (-),score=241.67 GEMP01007706.1:359-3601(-)